MYVYVWGGEHKSAEPMHEPEKKIRKIALLEKVSNFLDIHAEEKRKACINAGQAIANLHVVGATRDLPQL